MGDIDKPEESFQDWAWRIYRMAEEADARMLEEMKESLTTESESATIKGIMRKTKEGQLVVPVLTKRKALRQAADLIMDNLTWRHTVQGEAYWDRVYSALLSLANDGITRRTTPRPPIDESKLTDELDKIVGSATVKRKKPVRKASSGRRKSPVRRGVTGRF